MRFNKLEKFHRASNINGGNKDLRKNLRNNNSTKKILSCHGALQFFDKQNHENRAQYLFDAPKIWF